jgi:nicotinamidase-related amidase
MTDPLSRNAVLLVVDVQKGFDRLNEKWHRNNPTLEANVARLQRAWRSTGRPLIHVQHLSQLPDSPLRPHQPGCEIKDEVRPLPGERAVQKSVHSAFIGTDLEAELRRRDYTTLVITGIQTNICVSTTARMAGNLGFKTYVVSDRPRRSTTSARTVRVTPPSCCTTWRSPTCTASSPRWWIRRRSYEVWETAPDRADVAGATPAAEEQISRLDWGIDHECRLQWRINGKRPRPSGATQSNGSSTQYAGCIARSPEGTARSSQQPAIQARASGA